MGKKREKNPQKQKITQNKQSRTREILLVTLQILWINCEVVI